MVEQLRQRVDDLVTSLGLHTTHNLALRRSRLCTFAVKLETLCPLMTLARGYAICSDVEGRVLRSAEQKGEFSMTEPNAQELKFEEALARLEEIVRLLEQGESTLDESVTLCEEGVKLARFCSNKLDEAEGKIEIMIKEGQIQPLEVAEE